MSSGSNTDDQNINLTLSFSKAPFSTVRAFSTSPETYNDKKNLITKLPINFNHKVYSLSNIGGSGRREAYSHRVGKQIPRVEVGYQYTTKANIKLMFHFYAKKKQS